MSSSALAAEVVAAPDDVELRIEPMGWRVRVPTTRPLMAGARSAGIALPSSCRNGTCRACICRLVEGEVAYRIEWPGLSADEKREGWILPCVAHALTDAVVLAPKAASLRREDQADADQRTRSAS